MKNQKKSTAEELLEEIGRIVAENFVAIYERDGQDLVIRSVGGEKFRLTLRKE